MTDTANPPAPKRLPILPLRDVVIYPHTVIPLFVGRERSVAALDQAMAGNREILLVAQTQPDIDEPSAKDLYEIGTVATILQLLKLPDGTVKVLMEGVKRARLSNLEVGNIFSAEAEDLPEGGESDRRELDVLTRSVMSRFEQYVKLNKKIPPEILTSLSGIDSPSRLADTVAAQMTLKLSEKQKVLEISAVRQRLEHVLGLIDAEIDMLRIEKRIRGRVKQQKAGKKSKCVVPSCPRHLHPCSKP
jgi:ATP-dependent Lon protease